MEEQEKDVLFLMALAVSGAVLASGLAATSCTATYNSSFSHYDPDIFPVQT